MAHRGQRYFEQPLPDVNSEQSPPRKQPAFHEVFGNKNFRKFQQEGPGRARRNARGRGRGNRGFQFSHPRNQDRRYHDRSQSDRTQRDWNHHDRNHHVRNHHVRNHHERNQRDWNHHDRNPHDRNHRDRFDHDRNHHQRDLREADPRESGDGFHESEQQEPLFGPGTKRSAFQPIDFDGRRKRKRVPGGRITKFKRIEEFKGETYCDVCDEGFRDVNAKALHDRSKAHRRNFGYLRHETMEGEEEDTTNITRTNQISEDVRRKNLEDGTTAFLSKPLPKDFKEWAERSLTAAREAAAESNDPSLFQAVQREIIEVYRVNDQNCSLRRVCWTRRDVATGSMYRDSSVTLPSLPVIKDSELLTQDKLDAKKKEEANAGKHKSALSPVKAPRKTHAEAVDDELEESPMEVVDEAPPPPPPVVHPLPLSEPRVAITSSVDSIPLPTEHLPPYKEVRLKWRLSKAAKTMLSCSRTEHKEDVLAKYNDMFRDATMSEKDSAKEQADVNPKESLLTTYREVRREFDSEEYEYEDLMKRMSELVKQLRDDSRRVAQLRDVLQMQTKIALQGGEFRECRQPCSAFIRTFSPPLRVQGTYLQMVGQWFLSILLKPKPGSSRRGFPAMLEVAQEMRSFPAGAIADPWVHESIQAFRLVLGHNWSGFFKRSIEQSQGSPVSQMLEGFIPFMREKALLVLTLMIKRELATIRAKALPALPLKDFQSCLAWHSLGDAEASVEEVKDFIISLPHPFEIVRDKADRERIQWSENTDEELTLSEGIDVSEDVLSKWSKVRMLEDD